ncbi:hypothetical protein I316_01160 [Kwoniella heveanensis BCC8398]|uniref:Uncharacterized protein n=1 Tax=Kwoniella heveanensis BCC8398 TaxID=1296120 RepID=A0A1B9H1V3_9TREE|nr:hypothetical protein I316_01160 [Kwoniella heveanensis BCC8398]
MFFKSGTVFSLVTCLAGVKIAIATPVDGSIMSRIEARAGPRQLWEANEGPSPKDVKSKSAKNGWLATPLKRLAEINKQAIEDLFIDKEEDPAEGITQVTLKLFQPDGEESTLKFNMTQPGDIVDEFDRANDYWWVPSIEYAGLLQGEYDGLKESNKITEGTPAATMKMLTGKNQKTSTVQDNKDKAKQSIQKSKEVPLFFHTFDKNLASNDLEKRTWYSVVDFEEKNGKIVDDSKIQLIHAGLDAPVEISAGDAWKDLETFVRQE